MGCYHGGLQGATAGRQIRARKGQDDWVSEGIWDGEFEVENGSVLVRFLVADVYI